MLIDLQPSNKILEETLRERFNGEPEKVSMNIADFDGVTYKLSTPESKTVLLISMYLRCYPDLQKYGADAIMEREYGSLLTTPEEGYHISLSIDVQSPPEDKETLVQKVALLKRNALAAPFEAAFTAQQEGRDSDLMIARYRDEEAYYIKAQHDRVTVIFSTMFKEETDRIFGKVFLQEFVDARRSPAIQNAPQVLYTHREPPLELRGVPGVEENEWLGYVTFVLFPRHFAGGAAPTCISRIQLFRDYLHYHIKASKAYMHSRMRTRVDSFLKVLNRAKPEQPDSQKEKKTASGRTFRRT
ncbi:Arp2/3 complex, 34 kd subunit p34-Arc-domain-containing protein [Gaertneriomyces semiglobifer]|nr:Arp2/3 complex, 34 kd subunit p34-Arc-domain-containing protein [Gaertneriomyces semiglobifer]